MEYYKYSSSKNNEKQLKNWSKSIDTVKVAQSYITASISLLDKVKQSYSNINKPLRRPNQIKLKKNDNITVKPLMTELNNMNSRGYREVMLDSGSLSNLPVIPNKENIIDLIKKKSPKIKNVSIEKANKYNKMKFQDSFKYKKFLQSNHIGNIFYGSIKMDKLENQYICSINK